MRALNVAARIRSLTSLLTRQPRLGRRTSGGRLRRIIATPYLYHVFYEVTDAEVIVVAVRHAARDPASMPGGAWRGSRRGTRKGRPVSDAA